jgi:hypothetical protein
MITLVPYGGLANRMKAIDAAMALAHDTNNDLDIIWFRDQGLNCRFNELFQPLDRKGVRIIEGGLRELILLDRPRRKNLFVPRLFQQRQFDACSYGGETTERFYNRFDFRSWATRRKVYIASCVYFYVSEDQPLFNLFKPIPVLQQKIDTVTQQFDEPVVGIHIRRTDNVASIRESPTELFIKRMKQEPENTRFYLATDSEEEKNHLRLIFGERIISSPQQANRNTVEGMQAALVELYLLSRTRNLIGSSKSSYSETAAQLSGIQYEILI